LSVLFLGLFEFVIDVRVCCLAYNAYYLPVHVSGQVKLSLPLIFSSLQARCTNADKGNCYGYMSYRCKY